MSARKELKVEREPEVWAAMYASAAEERTERSQSDVDFNGIAVVARITRLNIDAVCEGENIILCDFWCQKAKRSKGRIGERHCQE